MISLHLKGAATAFAILTIAIGVLAAGAPAKAADKFGAIAFSQKTGAHGFSYDYQSQGAAQNRAMVECDQYGPGCRIASWFKNGCGALAVGTGNGWGAEWGNTRAEAERLALQRCRSHTGRCQIKRWVCTAR